ncbi:MAG: PASTA domain-containing protein [Clostridia bacterium]|nr:PASTA domain-containing protein [Clostridia bacterium]
MNEKFAKIPKVVKIIVPIAVVVIVLAVLLICGVFSSKVEVPDVEKLNIEEAQSLLEENGLTVFVDDVVSTDDVDENTVLSQDPKAGEKVEKNSAVGVVISQKAYQTEIPDLTDFSQELAVETIEAAGAQAEVVEEYSDTVPAGTVISQSVVGSAKSSDKVKIVVSKGSENTSQKADLSSVPDVVSQDKAEAKKTLNEKGIGMTIVSEEYSDTVKKGEIISQKTNEDTGSVEVVVSKGSEEDAKVVVPNVVFRTQSDAKKLLEKNDLKAVVKEQPSSTVSKGAVISQSVKAGTKVSAGSSVTIVVSSGKQEQTTKEKATKTTTTTTTKKQEQTTAPATKPSADATEKKTTTTREVTTSYDKVAEKQYVADFKITTDKTSAKAGDEIKVSVALKTNYRIFTVMLPVIYDGNVFEMQNTSEQDTKSFLTFEGDLAKTYKTNGNWKSVSQMYSRNNNESYWTQSDVMKRWKIAYASWAVDASVSRTPVMLSDEEVIVSFTFKVKSDVSSTEGRIFISSDFQKTSDCVKGILAVGRCKNETVDLNFVDKDQTIKVDRANVKIKIS